MRKKFILIAGNPRSGTTFVGKMLALNKSVQYLDEPFNAEFGMIGVKSYFPYISTKKPDEISLHNKQLVDDFFSGKSNFRKLDPKDASNKKQYIGRKIFGTKNNYQYKNLFYNPIKKTGIIKDPTASLLSLYMAKEYDIPIIVVLRHPLATMASFKRLGMVHGINSLVSQSDLNKEYIKKLEVVKNKDISSLSQLEHNCYHWLAINSILADFTELNRNFIIIKHEELSNNPIDIFRKLYDKVGLTFTDSIEKSIIEHTSVKNPANAPNNKMHHLKRDSSKTPNQWKEILNDNEIETIKSITYKFTNKYYDKSSWDI